MNDTEEAFAALARSEGWAVTKRGWPDFICRRDGELMVVEVKGRNDGLSYEQWQMIRDLRAAGIPTFVWNPDEGYSQVTEAVGESVFSLKQTIAELRKIIAKLQAPKQKALPEPGPILAWTFTEDDPQTITWLASGTRGLTNVLRCHTNRVAANARVTALRSGKVPLRRVSTAGL